MKTLSNFIHEQLITEVDNKSYDTLESKIKDNKDFLIYSQNTQSLDNFGLSKEFSELAKKYKYVVKNIPCTKDNQENFSSFTTNNKDVMPTWLSSSETEDPVNDPNTNFILYFNRFDELNNKTQMNMIDFLTKHIFGKTLFKNILIGLSCSKPDSLPQKLRDYFKPYYEITK